MGLTPSVLVDFAIYAILIVMGWHAFYCLRRRRFFVIDPLNAFWGGVLVCYIWQPLANFDAVVSWRGMEVVEKTMLIILVGVISLVVGYESRFGPRWTRFLPHMPDRLSEGRVLFAAMLMVLLGVVGYVYQASSAGGWSAWLAVGRGGTKWDSLSAYVAQLEYCLPVGTGLLLFLVEFFPEKRGRRLLVWAMGLSQWLWFIYLGTRSRTIAFALVMLAAYYLPKRRNPPILTIPVLFAVLAVLVNFEAAYRDKFTNLSIWGNIDFEEVKESAPEWLIAGTKSGEVSTGIEFNCVAAVVELVPSVVDYNYGYSHLEFLTRAIPRSIWPDKIYPHYRAYTPIYRAGGLSSIPIPTSREYLLMGPSFTFVGHWYSVGGLVALIAAGFMTGAAFRALRGVYDRTLGSQGDILLYSTLVPLGFAECAGEPWFSIFTAPFSILPLVAILFWCREKVPVSDASRQVA